MKRHPIDVFSLISGLFITFIAVIALTGPWRVEIGSWAWPTLLIGAGVVIIGLVIAGNREANDTGSLDEEFDGDLTDDRVEAMSAAYAELDDDPAVVPPHDDPTVDDD